MGMFSKVKNNFANFMNNDNLRPDQKYGIDPPKPYAMGRTEPRFSKDPSAGTMAPNPQAGATAINVKRFGNRYTHEQEYANYASRFTGDEQAQAFPVVDNRVPPVSISGKDDYQTDPHRGDPRNTRESTFSKQYVPFTGAESFFDNMPGLVDRDPGEVGTPVVYGDQSEYNDSDFEGVESPRGFLGNESIAPAPSHFPSTREDEKPDHHEDMEWIQPARNAVAHTGHDDDFGHTHSVPLKVDYSSSAGAKGTDRQVTVGGGPITRVPYVGDLHSGPSRQSV